MRRGWESGMMEPREGKTKGQTYWWEGVDDQALLRPVARDRTRGSDIAVSREIPSRY